MRATDFPRPENDNGWGVHGDANVANPQFQDDLTLLRRGHLKWYKVVACADNMVSQSKALLDAGVFPVVRLWRDRPNPGSLPERDREAVKKYIDVGVKYFETNNEPNLPCEWLGNRLPDTETLAGVVYS